MTERWGACRTCKGRGIVIVKKRDLILLRDEYVEQECGTCNGEGFSGRAEDCPWTQPDEERS